MYYTQFLSRTAIYILGHVSIGEVYCARIVVIVVKDKRDVTTLVGNQGTAIVVFILGTLGLLILKGTCNVVVCGSFSDTCQPIAVIGKREVIHLSVAIGRGLSITGNRCDVTINIIIPYILTEPVDIGGQCITLAIYSRSQPVGIVIGVFIATKCIGRFVLPPDATDVAVITRGAKTISIGQFLLKAMGRYLFCPSVKVVLIFNDRIYACSKRTCNL